MQVLDYYLVAVSDVPVEILGSSHYGGRFFLTSQDRKSIFGNLGMIETVETEKMSRLSVKTHSILLRDAA